MNELQIEQAKLNKLAEKNQGRVAVILEGRDTAGKTGTIRTVTQYLNPAWFSVCLSSKPSKREMDHWLISWKRKMPAENQIVFYDRSWYSRALVQPVNGWCSKKQYSNFMQQVMRWEEKQPIHFIKMWLSISEVEQLNRINDREKSPLKYWKLSENDKIAVAKYNAMSIKKESMFNNCKQWFSIDYDNKNSGRLAFIKRLNKELEKIV
jgi:polyphosphate kinase 2 (PPK2 family)